MRSMIGRLALHAMAAATLLVAGAASATAATYQDPPTLSSKNGSLSVLMIAAKRPKASVGGITTDLWTYEVCPLPAPGAMACPAGSQSGLSGVRLALQQGDTLRIRLINKLPPLSLDEADHIADHASLAGNPTNLHTHGFIVEPHRPVGTADPFGDYVFVEVRNSHNPIPPGNPHPGVDVVSDAAEYVYTIDQNHPSGLYWYHPHLHGISLNQVSAGLAGPITIGSPADVCGNTFCTAAVNLSTVRHLVLKDTQVLAGGTLKTQEEPHFCDAAPATNRRGTCDGQFIEPAEPATDFRGGKWLHTVSGQLYPTIAVGPEGDVWRILNASGSRAYALSLIDQASGKPLALQILAIDGVTLSVSPTASLGNLTALLGGKAQLMLCPGQLIPGFGGALCASTINMLPSSRVEVRVIRSGIGFQTQNAVFRTAEYQTGLNGAGDPWPQIDLAAVTLAPRGLLTPQTILLRDLTASLFSGLGQLLGPVLARVPGTTSSVPVTTASVTTPASGAAIQAVTPAASVAITPAQLVGKVSVPGCMPLATGHHRKILFGFPTPTTFGLGYVEVDQNGRDIEVTRVPIGTFDPAKVAVCVALPGGQAASELWELQNLTDEDHNFHIHQTRFFLVAGGVAPGATVPQLLNGNLVLHDNIPVPHPASPAGCADGTLDAVSAGLCVPSKTFIVIPFREIGDFVFHCHILEHEDGGIMARIRVVATQ